MPVTETFSRRDIVDAVFTGFLRPTLNRNGISVDAFLDGEQVNLNQAEQVFIGGVMRAVILILDITFDQLLEELRAAQVRQEILH